MISYWLVACISLTRANIHSNQRRASAGSTRDGDECGRGSRDAAESGATGRGAAEYSAAEWRFGRLRAILRQCDALGSRHAVGLRIEAGVKPELEIGERETRFVRRGSFWKFHAQTKPAEGREQRRRLPGQAGFSASHHRGRSHARAGPGLDVEDRTLEERRSSGRPAAFQSRAPSAGRKFRAP